MWTTLSKVREFKRNERMTRAQFEAFKLTKFHDHCLTTKLFNRTLPLTW